MSRAAVLVGEEIASRPPSQARNPLYKPQLDVLRFFAFFTVFIHHALPLLLPSYATPLTAKLFAITDPVRASGAYGLCIFFVLSAYLITELLLTEKNKFGSIDIKAFYVRRILRIWPLYFTFVFVCALFFWGNGKHDIEPMRFATLLLLAGNWYSGRFGFGGSPAGPLWSISLEEQFYLVWPAMGKYLRIRYMAIVAAAMVPLSLASVYFLRSRGASTDRTIWTNSFVQFLFFAVGALIAIGLHRRVLPERSGISLALIICALAVWLYVSIYLRIKSPIYDPPPLQAMFAYVLLALSSAALLIGALYLPRSWCAPPLVALGKISYGLYVFHDLSLQVWGRICPKTLVGFAAAKCLALLTTIALAELSYKFLEKPFLNLKRPFERIHSRPV